MRIAFVSDRFHPKVDGVTTHLGNWRRTFEAMGHDVHILHPDYGGTPGENEHVYPAEERRHYIAEQGYRFCDPPASEVEDTLTRIKPDVVHAVDVYNLAEKGLEAANKLTLPTVVSYHTFFDDLVVPTLPLSEIERRRLGQDHAARLKRVLGLAKKGFMLDSAMISKTDYKGIPTANLVHIPRGVDTDFFKPASPQAVERFRKGYRIDPERNIVGMAARLAPEKHVKELAAYWGNIAGRFNAQLVIAGAGPQEKDLAREAKTIREKYPYYVGGEHVIKENAIVLLGNLPRKDLPAFYSSLDLFLSPSDSCDPTLASLEAQACGTPAHHYLEEIAYPNLMVGGVESESRLDKGFPLSVEAAVRQLSKRGPHEFNIPDYPNAPTFPSRRETRNRIVKEHSLPVVAKKMLAVYEQAIETQKTENLREDEIHNLSRGLQSDSARKRNRH